MLYFKLIVLVAVLVGQTSCLRNASNPSSPGNTEDTTGDFRPLVITGQSVAVSENNHWQIPTEKTYEFRVCLQSRITNAQLPVGQKFKITAQDGTSQESETDNVGCLNWTEKVPFNFAADSMYIEKTRTLVGQGTYRGSSVLRYAINPWLQYRSDSGDEVVDLQRGNTNIPNSLLIKEAAGHEALGGLFSRSSSRNLYIDLNPSMSIIEAGDLPDGKLLNVIVQLKPYIEPLNLNQDRDKTYFKSGRFKVYVQLVADYVGESRQPQKLVLTPDIAPQIVNINTDNTIEFKQLRVPLRTRVTTGQVQLAIKVVPAETPDNFDLSPYEGLYNAGSFSNLFQQGSVTPLRGSQDPGGFDYAHHLESAANFEELRSSGWAHSLPPVEFSNLDPRFVQVKQGETSTERTVVYRVATRVTDGVHGGKVHLQDFTVVHPDGRSEVIRTDHEGFLYWRDELHHKYYMREHRILQKVKITHHRSQNQANHIIALNPWDEGWTFGADVRSGILETEYNDNGEVINWLSLSDQELEAKIAEKQEQIARYQALKPNLLFIDAFRYQTIRFRYVIDEFLTLNVKKAVVMALDPLVQRDTLYRGRIFEPLRDGVYLAKIALVKYFIDPFQNGVHLIQCDPEQGNCPCPEGDLTCKPENQKYHVQPVSDGGDARKGQYTTVIKKLIRVQAGRITTPLEFSMRDLRMMSVRSQIMVQLETIDERALLRDNIIDQRLDQLERQFFELNPETMTDDEKAEFQAQYGRLPEELSPEERERIIAARAAEYDEQRTNLLQFIEDSRTELERTRQEQSTAQLRRYELVDQIEHGQATGDPQGAYEEENPVISLLKRSDWRDLIEMARSNLGQMELEMKQHWSEWDQDWDDVVAGIHHGDYIKETETFRRHYMDYLLVGQTFLMGQGLEGVVLNERDLERMSINNYTQNPVAPLVDLNLYRNKSGLQRRTFIGPCTLVENDNMSEMRPTDTVDEKYCDRIDCGETLYEPRFPLPDNREFEESAHHDSLKPFASMHVDTVVQMHRENERRYEMEMDALSQMGNFVDKYNMSYVSLTDEPLRKYKQGCSFDGNENCFPETQDNRVLSNDFMNLVNEEPLPDLLGRYFLVNPIHELRNINEQVTRENSLEPLWGRTKRNPGIILSFLFSDNDDVPLDYSSHQGNLYNVAGQQYLRQNYNSTDDIKIETAQVSQWLSGGTDQLKLDDSLRLCYALSKQVSSQLAQTGKIEASALEPRLFNSENSLEAYILHKCLGHVRYLPDSGKVYFDGIRFDRRYKILKAGSYEHIRGVNMNINVGIDFSVSSYKDISSTTTAGVSDAGVLGITGAGIGAWVGGPIGAAVGASAGLIVASLTNSRSDGVSRVQTTSVNAATFLVVQKADFHINILEHEKCLSLKFGREFVDGVDPEFLHLKEGVELTDTSIQQALDRGFMICDGKPTTTPIKIPESYYYVTQHFTAGDMLDDVNLLNHVWLLALRGRRDYNEFVRILNSKEIGPDGVVIPDREIYDYPVSRLGRVYKQVVPTFPGLYSVQD